MAVFGIRCSNSDFCFVVIEGSRKQVKILDRAEVSFPEGYSRPHELKWFLQELELIFCKHEIKVVSIKVSEGMAVRDNSFVARVENETMVQLVAANKGIKAVHKKMKSRIAKDFGLKGRAKYLITGVDYSVIPYFHSFSTKLQEAILAAWSSLP